MKMSRLAVSALALTAAAMVGCNSSQKTSSAKAETKVVDTTHPVNAKCPIMGSAVPAGAVTVAYHDQSVGFCCAGCAGKWAKLTDAEKDTKLAAAMK